MAQVITGLTQVLYILISLLKLVYLFLRVKPRNQTSWLPRSFVLASLLSAFYSV